MKLISALKNVVTKSTGLRIVARKTLHMMQNIRYRIRGLSKKVDESILVFGSYNGKKYSCSPKAIYEYMVGLEKYRNFKYIWLFDEPEEYLFLEKNTNTKVVDINSREGEKYLHEAKYWIFNFRARDYWIPSKEQIYIQCWHGTPLKRLGYDINISDNAMNSIKEIRDKYKTDTKRLNYLISPCQFVTEKFTSAWNLQAYNKEKAIIETGYPRNDFLSTYDSSDIVRIKEKLKLDKCNKKIILYAPTWRDNQHDAHKGYLYDNPVDFGYLKEELGEEYIILFRAHYLVADTFDFDKYKGFVYDVSGYDDINELYVISDVLITDYSSVFFDYAILERPIVFYMYDMEEYRDEMRGFYLDASELPGPIFKIESELASYLKDFNIRTSFDEQFIKDFNKKYNKMNDGKASERLVEKLIHIH